MRKFTIFALLSVLSVSFAFAIQDKIGLSTSQKAIKKINEVELIKKGQRNLEKGGYVSLNSCSTCFLSTKVFHSS